jgi:copper transport protein
VSGVALAAVIVVALSGAVQSLLFLPSVKALFSTPYGWIVLAKIAGMAALVAFGAYHRYRVLPSLHEEIARATDTGSGRTETVWHATLRRSVWREVGVMTIVIMLGGLLAYVSPNVPEAAATAADSLNR